ncbi:MAG: asparagine synthase (glutamine-hydrolyzing) [Eubacteriales bacterium]|nr:asparagine synthase (glutamine-hydrolyzing) [Eubacteriales bacterium]
MSGIVGYSDFENNLSNEQEIIDMMSAALAHRGADGSSAWLCPEAAMGSRLFAVSNAENVQLPLVKTLGGHRYVIAYDGQIYNSKELRYELENLGHIFDTESGAEIVLTSYIQWREECPSRLNGMFAFAIWNESEKTLFLARDTMGIKPLFYSQWGSKFIFASEIKGILAHPNVEAVVDKTGIAEVFGLGPARTSGCGVFKDIHELKPAHFLKYSINGITIRRYWELESREHTDNLAHTAEKIRYFVRDAVSKQLAQDTPACTFLSESLDFCAVSTIAANQYAFENAQRLDTYSFEIKDGEGFLRNPFYLDDGKRWIDQLSYNISSKHRFVTAYTEDVRKLLEAAVCARDLPGMADGDASMLYFYSQVQKRHKVALSGECADEVFGGYSWFGSQKVLDSPYFPWQHSAFARVELLNPDVAFYADIDEYCLRRYAETVEKTPRLQGESSLEARRREIFYLSINWFLPQLLESRDRMSAACGMEIRMPFCDHRLIEYVWNVPWKMKNLGGKDKGILRLALKGILPDDVIEGRGKTNYKITSPAYEDKIKQILGEILSEPSSPLLQLINAEYVKKLISNQGRGNAEFFGHLMGMPQMLAYLVQVNYWLEKYRISIR